MSPRLNKSHLIVSVLAAAVILAGFVTQTLIGEASYPFRVAMWVSIAIVTFYFIGTIIRYYLISKVFMIDLEPIDDGELEQLDVDAFDESFDESDGVQETMMFEAPVGDEDDLPLTEQAQSSDEM